MALMPLTALPDNTVLRKLLLSANVYQDTSSYVMDTHAQSELFSAVLVTCAQGLRSMVLPTSKMWRPIMSLSFHIRLCSIEKAWVFLFHQFWDDCQNPRI
ncbi:hypothetical protein VPH35_036371 [Triticum aestivum]